MAKRKTAEKAKALFQELESMGLAEKITAINEIKIALHEASPFREEPVDCVIWELADSVKANDYNPNAVAPPEMELLRHSIHHDGYTQPVVTWESEDGREVIDGFHRTRVAKECADVKYRVHGYLPVVSVSADCTDRSDRIASTIRHNRARGKHQVDSMTDIVVELSRRNWSNKRIGKELGMDEDEILRLTQVSGLSDLFQDQEFSKSWDIGIFDDDELDAEFVSDDPEDVEPDKNGRIFHTWEKWECHRNRFYESTAPDGMDKEQAETVYSELLADPEKFGEVLEKVISEWKYSCEHYLTNPNMNRIAWLGQAALAHEHQIPSCFRGGYNRLTEAQKVGADNVALEHLNIWLERNGREPLTRETANSKTEANLY